MFKIFTRFHYGLFFLTLILPNPAWGETTVKRVAPGITLTQEIDKATPLVIHVLDVNLDAPGVHVGVGVGQDRISGADATHGREDVSRYTRRHHILAAVNADFFPYTGDPLGVGIKDGELFSEPWIPNARIGPRVAFGLAPNGKSVSFDTLGFVGDLQVQDGQRTYLNGLNRVPAAGEIVAFTPIYGSVSGARPKGTEVIVQSANLPVRANKLVVGTVQQVLVGAAVPAAIPSDGFVLSGAPGAGADFLAQHVHVGERLGFVAAVAPVDSVMSGFQIAALPRTTGDLPSRAGADINRQALFWAQAAQAVGGGPRLLVNGQVAIDGVAEGFDAGFINAPNPRTAVGTTSDGRHLIIVAVDGRQGISKGATLGELALIMKRYGAWNAMNFDGGGSTSMAVGGLTVNSPEGTGSERPVADMLLVDSDAPGIKMPGPDTPLPDPAVRLLLPASPVTLGTAMPLKITDGSKLVSGADPRVLWQGLVTGGVGFVNQRGYFIPAKPGVGTITALYNGQYLTGQITVVSSTPVITVVTLHADFAPDPTGATNRSQLTVRVLDQSGAPQSNTTVLVTVAGGAADAATVQTDPDGQATLGVTWDAPSGGSVQLRSGTLTPVTILQPKAIK